MSAVLGRPTALGKTHEKTGIAGLGIALIGNFTHLASSRFYPAPADAVDGCKMPQ